MSTPFVLSSSCQRMSRMEAAQSSVVMKPWLNFLAFRIFCTSSAGMGSPAAFFAYCASRLGWKAQFSLNWENISTKSRVTFVPLTEE